MAHIYLLFDFATDEEKAQHARHKLEVWKQAFRLDKKLLYKFDRPEALAEAAEPAAEEAPAKAKPAAKGKAKAKAAEPAAKSASAADAQPVKLVVRLAFSGHEKLSEQRWLDRIPADEGFSAFKPLIVKQTDPAFAETESRFESLA